MSEVIKVGMADLNLCRDPDIITTLGLGSCIGIALYDPSTKIGGLAHIMLPDSTKMRNNSNIAKFADTGIEELLNRMIKAGAVKSRLVAKIAGGAKMFEVSGLSDIGNVGQRNAEASGCQCGSEIQTHRFPAADRGGKGRCGSGRNQEDLLPGAKFPE